MSQPSRHQPSRDNVFETLAGFAELPVVLAEPATPVEQRQRALHHAPPGQDSAESFGTEAVPIDDSADGSPNRAGLAGMANDVHYISRVGLDPPIAGSRITGVHPRMLLAMELPADACEHSWKLDPVRDSRIIDLDLRYQTPDLEHEVTLAPAEVIAATIALDASYSGGLNRLAINCARAGLRVTTDLDAEAFPTGRVDALSLPWRVDEGSHRQT